VERSVPPSSEVEVIEASVGGLTLMELMIGYKRVILVDTLWSPEDETGQVMVFDVGDLPETLNTRSTHDADLPTALALGRRLGADLPDDAQIQIVAITAHDVLTFGDQPSPAGAAAIPQAAAAVLQLLGYAAPATPDHLLP
jgi:hydrogenase maturation protease